MPKAARNRSKYAGNRSENRRDPKTWRTLENPNDWTDDFLENCWCSAKKRNPIWDGYDKIAAESYNGDTLASALELIAHIDPVFDDALKVLRAYKLDKGGLKAELQRRQRRFGVRPAYTIALPRIANWLPATARRGGKESVALAVKLTMAQIGVPGDDFETVATALRKAFASYSGCDKLDRNAPLNFGDTGRKLKVRFSRPWLGKDNKPLRVMRGVDFADDGTGLAPDDQWWRRMIRDGHFELVRLISSDTGK
jgi:hypothetical protein